MKSFFFLLLLIPFIGFSQQPVTWSFDAEHIEGDRYNLVYTATIDKGWNVYSQFLEDGGPIPTSINYESKEGINLVGEGQESGYKKEGLDPLFEINVVKFLSKEPFVIKQEVKVTNIESAISGYLTFMCCDDERCLPPTDIDFSIDLAKAKKKSVSKAPLEKDGANASVNNISVILPASNVSSLSNVASPKNNLSEESDPVKWSFDILQIEGNIYELTYTANIASGWNVYSQYTSDEGPFPTMVTYENPDQIQLIGKSIESGHKKEGIDPLFDVNVIKFLSDQPYVIAQKARIADPSLPIIGYVTFMSCDDTKCLAPADSEFSLIPASQIAVATQGTRSTTDNSLDAPITDAGQVAATSNIGGLKVIDQVRPKLRETNAAPIGDCGETDTKNRSLWLMFGFGFLGGLLALLTPCVFPMIPLTVSFFTKDTKRKGWVNALIYALSIMFIYVSIGLIITGVFGASALNALSTNWIANTLFFVIFMFFAFSFFGFYELTLPSSWTTKTDSMADKGGLIGIFFMAFTLALVSFSCTGPIIGTALVQSATSTLGPFVVMLGFSMALALPFGLFAAFPAFLNSLPQSGGWMNSVKVVLGFLEVALAFKFLSVADLTSHWGFLRYELFLGIWIAVAIGMALYGFGFIKFPHDSPVTKLSPRRWAFSLGSIALAAYLATGFLYNDKIESYDSPGLLSGIAPPSTYNFLLAEPEVDPIIKAKYPSFGKCANNIDCFKDYYEGMAYAKEQGKPVLLDHTGYGCVNCRKTEEFIWIDDRVRNRLNEDYVLISLYVDDREKLEEVLISKTRENKIRNVGNKWTDFQIVNFDQISQPLYVMITPDEEVLALPRGYKEGINDYLGFLECGLATFKSVSVH
ncbi:MAG: thiol:disulfide interchange protein [Saprospiraceae bacterium]|jgi:thiol:disulfide interchange protein